MGCWAELGAEQWGAGRGQGRSDGELGGAGGGAIWVLGGAREEQWGTGRGWGGAMRCWGVGEERWALGGVGQGRVMGCWAGPLGGAERSDGVLGGAGAE